MIAQRDLENVAAAMKANKPAYSTDVEKDINRFAHRYLQWRNDVQALVRVFLGANPRFDIARFTEACGVNTNDRGGSI